MCTTLLSPFSPDPGALLRSDQFIVTMKQQQLVWRKDRAGQGGKYKCVKLLPDHEVLNGPKSPHHTLNVCLEDEAAPALKHYECYNEPHYERNIHYEFRGAHNTH